MTATSSSIEICSVALPLTQYHLLEIPNELLHLFDPSAKPKDAEPASKKRKTESSRLTIKGRYDDQAVLTTDTQTLALRAVSQSNCLLLCSIDPAPPSFSSSADAGPSKPALYLRSNVTDTLELTPVVPRLDRLLGLLKASQYEGEEEETPRSAPNSRPVRKYTLKQLKSIVQASPAELEAGLVHNHVIELDGYMRHLSPTWMVSVLQILISHLDLHALIPDAVPLQETVEALEKVHSIRPQISNAILTQFFGSKLPSDPAKVALDTKAIVLYLGVQSLKSTARIAISLSDFMATWTNACLSSADFLTHVNLDLLSGFYLLSPSPAPGVTLYPNPASVKIQFYSRLELPADPAARFQDLFLTRSAWLAADLLPFIKDLALNDKKKDSLLLKFTRASKTKVLDWELSEEEKRQWNKEKKVTGKNAWREVVMYSARVKY
ncbi:uncharacterized protein UBRO_07026 [Ustilago bromivora]|uniref:Sister chromatid cohesion protein DCC1 n=1 Tax=Ustilago bromivora TaxID=307758 RepID=A0A1K0HBH9_9BASI|nr:uncharacterized protein UBRO_07026 [Ustilago bromivora]SYW76714.1 uncharacterized protein UBRO2_01551 [Ustilago bromivora]